MLFSPSSGFLASISLVLLLISPSAVADCTRSDLLAVADKFVTAVSSGSIGSLPFAANFTYLENNKVATINRTAVFAQPLKIDLNRSTADTVACASYTLIISASGPKPYVLATQIRHPEGGDTSVIAKVDTIAATTGSLFFNATKTLGYIRKENWDEIPEAQRPSRDLLKKVGDGYLDMWTDKTAADSIPWGTDCERVEGSEYTRPCGASLPHGGSQRNNGNRRYVIDEVVGSVDILCSFDALGSLPDSHEIRVEEGKVNVPPSSAWT
ncbi:e8f89b99-fc6d-4b16-83ea-962eb1901f0a [Thermothielavioides terrestris]|uniref:E8f89b99-fc6d-4b16-83ea-962eb1901f0a n=1 Tax=Thermothielavioides terrestris TaxID=2587410 RepID=A0A446BUV1_9PEZI|nr:e8f89b99-fc6d-4b16-83ea-962eb1901f0a [Thermothielavioides terrestris]